MNLTTRRVTETNCRTSHADPLRVPRHPGAYNSADLRIGRSTSSGHDRQRGGITDFVLSCPGHGPRYQEAMLYLAVSWARRAGLTEISSRLCSYCEDEPCLEFFRRSWMDQQPRILRVGLLAGLSLFRFLSPSAAFLQPAQPHVVGRLLLSLNRELAQWSRDRFYRGLPGVFRRPHLARPLASLARGGQIRWKSTWIGYDHPGNIPSAACSHWTERHHQLAGHAGRTLSRGWGIRSDGDDVFCWSWCHHSSCGENRTWVRGDRGQCCFLFRSSDTVVREIPHGRSRTAG